MDAYYCISALVGGSQSKFLSQTKIANEAHWRAAMILGRKHIVSFICFPGENRLIDICVNLSLSVLVAINFGFCVA